MWCQTNWSFHTLFREMELNFSIPIREQGHVSIISFLNFFLFNARTFKDTRAVCFYRCFPTVHTDEEKIFLSALITPSPDNPVPNAFCLSLRAYIFAFFLL